MSLNLEKRKRSEKIIEKEMREHVRICSFPETLPLSHFLDFINPPLSDIIENKKEMSILDIKEVVSNY